MTEKEKLEALLNLLSPAKVWDSTQREYVVSFRDQLIPVVVLRNETAENALMRHLQELKWENES
jgi:hypothetical protein